MTKRIFDVLLAGVALVLLSVPMAVVAVLIRATSEGPVLFRQVRVGRYGRPFEILKFRTMRHAPAGDGPLLTVAGDRRITAVGKVLRATKLDELPQLWNVVRGDMSLVGPRPEVPRYVALYPADVAAKVLAVRPGITDEASIRFRNENDILAASPDPERTYVDEILPAKLDMHTRYAAGHSLLGDASILARTAWCVIAKGKSRPARKGKT